MSEAGPGDGRPGGSASSRAAFSAVARSVGEVVAKAASVAFYLVLARELGEDQFGDFIFGLSLSQVLLTFAGLGSEELLARTVARDHSRTEGLFADVAALKAATVVVMLALIAGIVRVGGYTGETLVAIMLVSSGIALERQARNYHAVFQGFERNELTAASLIAARFFTAGVGVTALLLGAGIVPAAAIFAGGSATGNLVAWLLMRRSLVRPRMRFEPGRWPQILRASVPLGLVTVLYLLLIRLDSTMLGFLAGGAGDNTEVGQYGAAHRLVESTMFVSWAIGGAMLPWLSRHSKKTAELALSRGYEIGLKALMIVLVPIAITYVVLAEPLIDLLYGDQFDGAVGPLRLLGAMTVLFGVNTMVGVLMISRGSPRDFVLPAGAVIIQNAALNFALIPAYGASGAAFNAVLSGSILAVWTMRNATRKLGSVSHLRIGLTPCVAGAALAGVLWLTTGFETLSIAGLAAGGVAYLLVAAGVERLAYPGDYAAYRRVARPRGRQLGDAEVTESVGASSSELG